MAYEVTIKAKRFAFNGKNPELIEATKTFRYKYWDDAMSLIGVMTEGSIDEVDFSVRKVEEEQWQTD